MSPRFLLPRRSAIRLQNLHTTRPLAATALPITAHGPPPQPPAATPTTTTAFRLRQKTPTSTPRFWKTVTVSPSPGGYRIHLDSRTLKTSSRRQDLVIPTHKPLLAYAVALEWSNLRTTRDATRPHLIPLTQMAARAMDMTSEERAALQEELLRYLDTDTVLCIAPASAAALRAAQEENVRSIVAGLVRGMWAGVELRVHDGDFGFAQGRQEEGVRERCRAWMQGLDAWTLVGFERIVLATKSFVIGGKMVAEWGTAGGEGKWGVEEAAQAASLEVAHQTRQWGEVEDTHDVEKEDIRRQIGAGWLMITEGEKTGGNLG